MDNPPEHDETPKDVSTNFNEASTLNLLNQANFRGDITSFLGAALGALTY